MSGRLECASTMTFRAHDGHPSTGIARGGSESPARNFAHWPPARKKSENAADGEDLARRRRERDFARIAELGVRAHGAARRQLQPEMRKDLRVRDRRLDGRQLPQPFQQPALAVLDEQHAPLRIRHDDRRNAPHGQLLLRRLHGIVALRPVPARRARGTERTRGAARVRRRADERAELHHRLVEVARHRGRGNFAAESLREARARRELLEVAVELPVPGEDARDVAVDDGNALAVEHRGERGGRVGADARHGGPRRRRMRPARRGDHLRSLEEVARARIVAEPFPRLEDVGLVGGGERLHGREALQEARVVRQHGGVRRLLHHDLAQPAGVGRGLEPPRHRALHLGEPRLQPRREAAGLPHAPHGVRPSSSRGRGARRRGRPRSRSRAPRTRPGATLPSASGRCPTRSGTSARGASRRSARRR